MGHQTQYLGTDWYCDRVISGELPIVELYRSDRVLAFVHPFPYFEHHIVIIPIAHVSSITHLISPEDDALLLELNVVAIQFARQYETEHGGAVVLTNVGDQQSPTSKHLHMHVYCGSRLRED